MEKEMVLKTSRRHFLANYFIAAIAVIFLVLLINAFSFNFSFLPKNKTDFYSTLLILGIMAMISALAEQPEWERFRTHYIVTNNEVVKVEGILNKHRIVLPYQSVGDIRVFQSFLGRLLNYGDVLISGFKAGSDIDMKGVRNPQEIHTTIQNRVNMIREGQVAFFGKGKEAESKEKENKEND